MIITRVRTPSGADKPPVIARGKPHVINVCNTAYLTIHVENQVTLGKGSLVRIDLSKADVRKLAATFGAKS